MNLPPNPTPLSVLRAQLQPVAMVFLLPLLSLGFTHHAIGSFDDSFVRRATLQMERDATVTPEQRAEFTAFVTRNPPSGACVSTDPALARYRENLSGWCSDTWQFLDARRASHWALVLGLFATLAGAGLALLAHFNARAQYASFVIGWRAMQVFAAIETMIQGVLAVWLSFWVTAFFFHIYIVKIILVVAVFALYVSWHAIRSIFLKPPPPPPVEALRVEEERASGLFARIRQLCARVGTEAPSNLLVGIDDNFFVTECPLDLVEGRAEGRSLYVSLALLRVLDREETDAVLAHEMGHFVGGDTAFTLRMAPRRAASVRYLVALADSALPVFYFMNAYFAAFNLALLRAERDREFAADALSARIVSGAALGRALVKIAAYSSYRTRVEAKLFDNDRTHESLSIASRIADGFATYAAGEDCSLDLRVAATPHPFDTHPALDARLDAVGARVAGADLAAVLLAPAATTWRSEVADADTIEARLWTDYEARFHAVHERSLAFRYLPSTPEEEAVVVRYFPVRSFAYEHDTVEVDFKSVTAPAWARFRSRTSATSRSTSGCSRSTSTSCWSTGRSTRCW